MKLQQVAALWLGASMLQISAGNAQPSSIGSEPSKQAVREWTLDVGPAVVVAPWFEGGAYYRVLPVPNLDLRYRQDKFFVSARDGVGATLLEVGSLKAGPIFRYRFPRNEWDGPGLFGTGTVPFTIEGGAFVRYDLPSFAAKLEVRRGLGGSNGLILDLLADAKVRIGDTIFLSGGPRLSVTDGTYNQAYFGINAAQSAASGYAQYYPGAGLRSIGAGASGVWRVTDRLSAVVFGSYGYLGDVAGYSPLVTGPAGSRHQLIGGVAMTYRFQW